MIIILTLIPLGNIPTEISRIIREHSLMTLGMRSCIL